MFSLIPRDNSFFAMFSAMSDNLIAGARVLVDLFANYMDVEKQSNRFTASNARAMNSPMPF